ncbi:hypothetical protein I314_03538 [Cryptococcus bacillisporus CA1873]|uniref:Phosphatidic acid phosphatase type 2/haloperoxidase domain-containing protein n=2 Tax=Cryptococcus gattii TaxID=552467 RepID=A0A0D0UGH3_CRYGA|nr:hypothetical protein I312_03113 [Cryptococcus bacillisporus CA1280]KIR62592.1 hypothetical protein I314_03538 [Cryptococcus bacillisporus CA1873]|eukprot:KIR62592.1 hypothetical protein I314_03538 [Cryptococcus gattii CA1873]
MLRPHSPSEYPSLLLYILDETHITVTFTTAFVIIYTRNAHAVWLAIGALGSSLTAKALKKLIRGPRPPPPPDSSASPVRPKKTYGMPSTHSTALTFYAAYMLPSLSSLPLPYLSGLGIVGYWASGLWSRKELGYHTWEQIGAGALTGVLMSLIWRGIWNNWDVEGTLQPLIDHVWKAVVG